MSCRSTNSRMQVTNLTHSVGSVCFPAPATSTTSNSGHGLVCFQPWQLTALFHCFLPDKKDTAKWSPDGPHVYEMHWTGIAMGASPSDWISDTVRSVPLQKVAIVQGCLPACSSGHHAGRTSAQTGTCLMLSRHGPHGCLWVWFCNDHRTMGGGFRSPLDTPEPVRCTTRMLIG
eukprot:5964396-Amphidinium_carterae.2